MNSPRYRTLSILAETRRYAADVVTLADLCIYGSPSEADVALRGLPTRLRRLQTSVQRALAAIEGEGGASR
jgi:hypothetical protein